MMTLDCNECYYSEWFVNDLNSGRLCCKHPNAMYATCEDERGVLANCGREGRHYLPQKHDPQVGEWQEFCENCTKVLMLLFGDKKQIPQGITVGEVVEKYACLGGDCPDLKTIGSKDGR